LALKKCFQIPFAANCQNISKTFISSFVIYTEHEATVQLKTGKKYRVEHTDTKDHWDGWEPPVGGAMLADSDTARDQDQQVLRRDRGKKTATSACTVRLMLPSFNNISLASKHSNL
jgi:hypothetical protein